MTPATTSPVWMPIPNSSLASPRLAIVGGERLAHGERGLDGVGRLPGVVLERAEQGHEPVAHQTRQVAVVGDERPVHGPEVAVQHLDHLRGGDPFGERREPFEIGEHDGDVAVRRLGGARALRELLDDVERGEALERLLDVTEPFDGAGQRRPVAVDLRAQAAGAPGQGREADDGRREREAERRRRRRRRRHTWSIASRTQLLASAAAPTASTSTRGPRASSNGRVRD